MLQALITPGANLAMRLQPRPRDVERVTRRRREASGDAPRGAVRQRREFPLINPSPVQDHLLRRLVSPRSTPR